MRVFFDNCTSPVLATTLNGFLSSSGNSAIHIRDLPCGRHAADVEWIAYLGQNGREDWLVVTGDRRITKIRPERLAFRQARLRGIVLAPAYQKTPVNQQAAMILWRWPDIANLLRFAAPFLFELPISRSGQMRSLPL